MAQKSTFVLRPIGARKRVLLVAESREDADRRSDCLRRRGYEVDSVTSGATAVVLSRSRSYDLIVLPVEVDSGCVEDLSRRLQRLNPNTTIACLADCKKPIPSLPAARLLWKGEPLEYFLARIDAMATSA